MFDEKSAKMGSASEGSAERIGNASEAVYAYGKLLREALQSKMGTAPTPGERVTSVGNKTSPFMSSSGESIAKSNPTKPGDKFGVIGKHEPPVAEAGLYTGRKAPNAPPHQLELPIKSTTTKDGVKTTTSTNKATGKVEHTLVENLDDSSSSSFYDANGKLTHTINFDSEGNEKETRTYSYDAIGKQIETVQPAQNNASLLKDEDDSDNGPLNHISRTTVLPNGTMRETYFDKRTGEISMISNLHKDGGHSDYSYDKQGRILKEWHYDLNPVPITGPGIEYDYDANGKEIIDSKTSRLSDGTIRNMKFDPKTGKINHIDDDFTDLTFANSTNELKDGISRSSYDYDAKGRPTSAKHFDSAGFMEQKISYTYDENGNRTAKSLPVEKPSFPSRTINKAGDKIKSMTIGGGGGGGEEVKDDDGSN